MESRRPPYAPPDGLPVLTRGAHRSPRQGSCVMEYVSVLAGEPWSDRPACTLPALAHLARRVNDDVRDDVRGTLPELAPLMIGTADDLPGASETVVIAIARAALDRGPDIGRDLATQLESIARVAAARRDRHRQRGDRARRPRRGRHVLGTLRADHAYAHLVASVAHRPREERDALRRLALARAIDDVRRELGADGGLPRPARDLTVTSGPSALVEPFERTTDSSVWTWPT